MNSIAANTQIKITIQLPIYLLRNDAVSATMAASVYLSSRRHEEGHTVLDGGWIRWPWRANRRPAYISTPPYTMHRLYQPSSPNPGDLKLARLALERVAFSCSRTLSGYKAASAGSPLAPGSSTVTKPSCCKHSSTASVVVNGSPRSL